MVVGGGFEPPKAYADRFTVCSLWPLGNPTLLFWSWRWDLNPQPADYKSAALPIELRQQQLNCCLYPQAPKKARTDSEACSHLAPYVKERKTCVRTESLWIAPQRSVSLSIYYLTRNPYRQFIFRDCSDNEQFSHSRIKKGPATNGGTFAELVLTGESASICHLKPGRPPMPSPCPAQPPDQPRARDQAKLPQGTRRR